MADIRKLAPLILKWEGKFADDPADAGGPTHMGVTLQSLIGAEFDKNNDGLVDIADLKALNEHDVIFCFLKPFYWDRWQADRIMNQSVANLLVDWVWMSGIAGIKIPQGVLGVKSDGIVGDKTISAVNNYADQQLLFDKLNIERKSFIERICKARPVNRRFRNGWLRRLADFRYIGILLMFVLCSGWGGCKSIAQPGHFVVSQQASTLNTRQKEMSSSDVLSSQEIETCWDEIGVITSDSMPEDLSVLLNNAVSSDKGVYIRRKRQVTKTNHLQQKVATCHSDSLTKDTSAKSDNIKMSRNNQNRVSGNLKLFLSVVVFILLVLFLFANRIKSFFSK